MREIIPPFCIVMKTYIYGKFPVFEGFNHMQYQIRDPEGFARMLEMIIETDNILSRTDYEK